MATKRSRRGCLVGFVLGLALLGIWLLIFRQTVPALSVVRMQVAQTRWAQVGPRNYYIRVRVSGRQAALYEVEVRDGEVVRALRNEKPLKQQRTLGTWSVPGMFATIQLDLDALARATQQSTQRAGWLTLRAEFHPEYGYPQKYHRIDTSANTGNPEVYWEVEAFEIRTAAAPVERENNAEVSP